MKEEKRKQRGRERKRIFLKANYVNRRSKGEPYIVQSKTPQAY